MIEPREAAPPVLSASALSATSVRNTKGETLGTVRELMLDTERNRVAYVVVSLGDFLGLGSKLFPIPWDAMVLDTDEQAFVLDAEREHLEVAPGFDEESWPTFADPAWILDLHAHYGTEPFP
jgi:sporulation protein YlmC with PRC-barrel domain